MLTPLVLRVLSRHTTWGTLLSNVAAAASHPTTRIDKSSASGPTAMERSRAATRNNLAQPLYLCSPILQLKAVDGGGCFAGVSPEAP